MENTVRMHDVEVFLKEDRRKNPKECFKFISKQASGFIQSLEKPRILDVGCATGEFLFYLSSIYKNSEFTGIDIIPELIARAKSTVPNVNFIIADIVTGKDLPNKKFDVVFCIGVHSLFDNYSWIDNLMELVSDKGRVYIFGFFNPEDVDVLIKLRRSNDTGPWQTGWNIFSKRSISNYLQNKGLTFRFKDWKIGIDLAGDPNDPLRSKTLKLEDGTRLIYMGAQLLLHFSLLEIMPNELSK